MSRTSNQIYINNVLADGFDYDNQACVVDGFYVRCGHPESTNCNCFGRLHEGKPSLAIFSNEIPALETHKTPMKAVQS